MIPNLPSDARPIEHHVHIMQLERQLDALLDTLIVAIGKACGIEWLDHDRLVIDHKVKQAYETAFSILEELGYIQQVGPACVLVCPEECGQTITPHPEH